jgi:hypothetical protein
MRHRVVCGACGCEHEPPPAEVKQPEGLNHGPMVTQILVEQAVEKLEAAAYALETALATLKDVTGR